MNTVKLLRYGKTFLKELSNRIHMRNFYTLEKFRRSPFNLFSATRLFTTYHQQLHAEIKPKKPDAPIGSQRTISSVKFVPSDSTHKTSKVCLTWSDGHVSKFASLHLRDSCRCEKCFDKPSLHRAMNLFHDVPIGIEPKDLWTEGNELHIEWEDGHRSSYSQNKLDRLNMSANETNIYLDRSDIYYWKADYKISHYDYASVMNDDSVLVDLMQKLKSHGIALIKKVPCQEGQIRIFGSRFGDLTPTHYKDIFTVKSTPNANNIAFTSSELKLHIDLVSYSKIPSVQMLHCIQSSESGGENMFVDGINCAEHLRESDPEAFEILTQYNWPYFDITYEKGKMHCFQVRHPVIQMNKYNKIDKLAYCNFPRDDIGETDPDFVYKLYRAWYAFSKVLHEKQFTVEYLLKNGDLIIFDNARVLHGRTAYVVNPNSKIRHYEGAYLEWDAVMSTLRANMKKHK